MCERKEGVIVMGRKINQFLKIHRRFITASFFTMIMIIQVMSGAIDVVAYEIGKVKLSDTTGAYYGQDVNANKNTLNNDVIKKEDVSIPKDANVHSEEDSYDERLEVKEKRTSTSKTYKLEDGTYVTETYFEPIHKLENNTYVEIDNSIENISKARTNPIYENKDGLYTFKVQDKTTTITNAQNQTMSIINEDANLNTSSVKDNVILYSEAYDNIDMEYRLHGNSVKTNLYINGVTTQKEIQLSIDKGNLVVKEENDALVFLDDEEHVVYSYRKPLLYDANDEVGTSVFSYVEKADRVNITITLNAEWINDKQRIYPIMMSTRVGDESAELSIETAYNRSSSPDITSTYYDLYVGYEDGATSGGTFLGVTRSYVHVSNLNLGPDKEIVSGSLKMWKRAKYSNQWNELAIGKTSGYIAPARATWNNRPAVTQVSTVTIREDAGWQDFDVTDYVKDINKGIDHTLEIKATNESVAFTPNVFSSESGTGLPRITITYRDAFDIDPNLPLDTFDTEMRIFSIINKGWEAFSFDGIAKPDSQISFDLVERGKDDVIMSETANAKANKYFIDPIYITNYLENTQVYPKSDINYTTDYIYKDRIPKFDTPYEYKVRVKTNDATSTKEFVSDAFIKYKVKIADNLKTIASYYGLTIDEIKADNNLQTNIIKEDDVLLLRFKKNNDKVSKDVYTPPLRSIEYKAKYVNRGAMCSDSVCTVIDPVNVTTGNYFYEGIDFSMKDAQDFNFYRYYNSTGPQLSNMFGNGFTTPIESYITYDKNANMLYFTGDGRIFSLKKTASGYEARPSDKLEVTSTNDEVSIKQLDTGDTYHFDVYGYLESITSKEGVKTRIQYDAYGLITSIYVGDKRITFTYNDAKLVSRITLPNQAITKYTYDENRNLVEFIDTKGNAKKYTYDNTNYLTSITDKNGNVVTKNTYDSQGRVHKQIDGNGNTSSLTYDDHKTVIRQSDGSIDEYTFNDEYDTLQITQDGIVTVKNTYDENRNIISSIDHDGNTVTYQYDHNQNVTKTEYDDGTFEEYRYDTNGNMIYEKDREGVIRENTFDNQQLIKTTDSNKNNITYVYDDQGRVIKETDQFQVSKEYTYIDNMVASITHSNGLVESFVYDANGNTVKESDNQGKNTTYVYSVNNELTQKNYYDGTNEQWTYDANGNICIYKDRIGGITENTYDKNNNLIKSTKGNLTTRKQYNEINQVIEESDTQGISTIYTYDVFGNKASQRDGYGNTTTYQYDAHGNVVETTDVHGNKELSTYENGNLIASTSKDGLTTTYEYDERNREIKKVYPNKTTETKTYNGALLVEEKNQKNTKIEHLYDEYDREIKTITTYADGVVSEKQTAYDMYGNIIETTVDGVRTSYGYDLYNRLLYTKDALGNITKKEYDLDNNITKEIDALGNATITSYDGNKNITAITDKNGHTQTKAYNSLGQLVSERDALGYVKTYTYNTKGQLMEVMDPYKRKITYHYDSYGNQIETKLEDKTIEKKTFDTFGREVYTQTLDTRISSTYDEFDRISEKTDELTGLITKMSYDRYGNLVEEKDQTGRTITYEYDKYQRKIKTIDGYGRKETLTYNLRDQIVRTKAFDNTKTSASYDVMGNVIESKDALGNTTKNTYDVVGRLIKEEKGSKATETVYDGNSQVIEVKNLNNQTSTKTIYDCNGMVVETIDALGNSTKTEYDAKNQAIASIDALGNRSTKDYDAYGNVVKETNALGYAKQSVYNSYGLLEKEIDERGFDTTYEYNDDLLVSKIIDPKGNYVQWKYNDKLQKVEETSANGGITQYEYDTYGQVIKQIAPNGKTNQKTYDALGNVIKEIDGLKTIRNTYDSSGRLSKTSINGVVQTKNIYNQFNQIIKSYDAEKHVSTYKYDAYGRVIYSNEKGFISEKTYDINDNVIKQVDNHIRVSEHTYDVTNRLVETKVNAKVTMSNAYDPNGNEIRTMEDGVEVRKTYNEINKLIKVELPSSSNANTFVAIQSIEYDESGNPISIMDAFGNKENRAYDANYNVIEETNKNGFKTLYEYDGENNIIKAQNHEERYVSYAYNEANQLISKNIQQTYATYDYDEDGNLLSEENEYGYKRTYSYDAFGRKQKEVKPDGTSIQYTYDKLGNKLTENKNTYTYDKRGNVLTATNQKGTVKNEYDAFNQKTSVYDTNENLVTYDYDENQNITSMNYGGIKVSYSYNDHGLLEHVKKDDVLIASYTYNARNEIIQLDQVGTTTNKTYDDMGRVLSQKTQKDGKQVIDTNYAYDANDNVVKEVVDGKTNTYKYDAYDELTQSKKYVDNKKITTTYQHDFFGNQIESSTKSGKKIYNYNDKNQVTSIKTEKGTITYQYDDNGNVEEKTNEDGRVDTYTYDDFNQLTKLEQGQFVYTYTYDAEKERVSQTWTDTKDYHYDQWYDYTTPIKVVSDKQIENTFQNLRDQVTKKQDNKNICTTESQESYDMLHNQDSYDVTYYKETKKTEYIVDRNKEYTDVLKANDTVNVYGETLLQSNDEQIVTGWNDSVVAKITSQDIKKISYNDYGSTKDLRSGNGYNGDILDQTGLIYLRARYYDPSVSRFVQIDTNYEGEKENIASQNRYVYTMNNPYKYVDRDGNRAKKSKTKVAKPNPFDNVVKAAINIANEVNSVVTSFGVTNAMVGALNTGIHAINSLASAGNTSTKGKGSNAVKPVFKKVKVEAKCPEKEKRWYEKVWDGVVGFGEDLWKGATDVGSAIWSGICDTGSFVVKKGKEFLTWIDGALDTVARVGSVIVFAAGAIALGSSLAIAIPALAGVTILGASIGAIGATSGCLALYGGAVMMGIDGVQTVSGYTGYRLDGSRLTKSQAEARIQNGQTNLTLAFSGAVMGNTGLNLWHGQGLNKGNEGASGAKVIADDIKFTDKFSMKDYKNQVASRGWSNQKIADAINSPYKVVDSVNNFTGNPAKVYFINETHYVVIDTVTNKVVQVSNVADDFWKFTPGNFTK